MRESAASRFWSWLRRSVAVTVTPVGRWTRRTALSVLFRCCPPGPRPRRTSPRTRRAAPRRAAPPRGARRRGAPLESRRPPIEPPTRRPIRPCGRIRCPERIQIAPRGRDGPRLGAATPRGVARRGVPEVRMGRRGASPADARRWVFNRLAEDYRQRPGYPAPLVARLLSLAGGPGARVADLGAGTGQLALPLAALGAEVHAVEPARAMLDVLAAARAPGVTAVHAAAEETASPAARSSSWSSPTRCSGWTPSAVRARRRGCSRRRASSRS